MAVQDRPCIQLLQVCLLDLDYNLPVQVRDQALAEAGEVIEALPQSDAGREYALNRMQQEGNTESSFGQGAANNDTILRLQRTTPYYKVPEYCHCGWRWRKRCGCSAVHVAAHVNLL